MSIRLLGNGRYVLGDELGAGGMGTVYVAEDLVRIERVAVKVAHGDRISPDVVALHMARELRAGRATQHPNVVSIIDGGIEASGKHVRVWAEFENNGPVALKPGGTVTLVVQPPQGQ